MGDKDQAARKTPREVLLSKDPTFREAVERARSYRRRNTGAETSVSDVLPDALQHLYTLTGAEALALYEEIDTTTKARSGVVRVSDAWLPAIANCQAKLSATMARRRHRWSQRAVVLIALYAYGKSLPAG